MEQDKQIRLLDGEYLSEAVSLVWEVFAKQLAQQCTDVGIEEFWHALDEEYLLHRMGDGTLRFWGAFDGQRLVGVCTMRELTHVLLLFVEPDTQRQGAGTALLKKALLDCKALDPALDRVTVEALGESRGFFEKLGFAPWGNDSFEDGILKTTMALSAGPEAQA